jgi:hypothetical protein
MGRHDQLRRRHGPDRGDRARLLPQRAAGRCHRPVVAAHPRGHLQARGDDVQRQRRRDLPARLPAHRPAAFPRPVRRGHRPLGGAPRGGRHHGRRQSGPASQPRGAGRALPPARGPAAPRDRGPRPRGPGGGDAGGRGGLGRGLAGRPAPSAAGDDRQRRGPAPRAPRGEPGQPALVGTGHPHRRGGGADHHRLRRPAGAARERQAPTGRSRPGGQRGALGGGGRRHQRRDLGHRPAHRRDLPLAALEGHARLRRPRAAQRLRDLGAAGPSG